MMRIVPVDLRHFLHDRVAEHRSHEDPMAEIVFVHDQHDLGLLCMIFNATKVDQQSRVNLEFNYELEGL